MEARETPPTEQRPIPTVGEVTHTGKREIIEIVAHLREQTDEAEREEGAI